MLWDAAGTHVEEGGLVQAADGGAVGALYVIGINLKLGEGLIAGGIAQQDVVVLLISLSVLGIGGDDDDAVESNLGRSTGKAVEKLGGVAAGRAMMNEDAEIHALIGVAEVQAAQMNLRPGADEVDAKVDVAALARQHHEVQVEDFASRY